MADTIDAAHHAPTDSGDQTKRSRADIILVKASRAAEEAAEQQKRWEEHQERLRRVQALWNAVRAFPIDSNRPGLQPPQTGPWSETKVSAWTGHINALVRALCEFGLAERIDVVAAAVDEGEHGLAYAAETFRTARDQGETATAEMLARALLPDNGTRFQLEVDVSIRDILVPRIMEWDFSETSQLNKLLEQCENADVLFPMLKTVTDRASWMKEIWEWAWKIGGIANPPQPPQPPTSGDFVESLAAVVELHRWAQNLAHQGDRQADVVETAEPAVTRLGNDPSTHASPQSHESAGLPPFVPASALARRIGQPLARVDSDLRRFRVTHPDCWTEVENVRRNEPRILYRTADVWPSLQERLAVWRREQDA